MRALYRLSYGYHPYASRATEQSLANIEVTDLSAFHAKYYVQKRATIAMIGAVNRDRAAQIAESLVASLPQGNGGPDAIAEVSMLQAGKQEFIDHPGAQSHLYIGKPLLARGDPDYFSLLVANNILGGASFVSRLYQEIREKRGLAYSVSSHFSLSRQPGLFTIGLQTRREKTTEALQAVRDVLTAFVEQGPTQAELEAARSNLSGGFVFRMDTNGKILGLLSAIGFHKLPLDYLDKWTERVNAVTLDQVRDALRRRLDPSAMVTVVAGAVNGLGSGASAIVK